MKDYSQYGESRILSNIFDKIGTINNFSVEFGASDGYKFSNTRFFLNMGWNGLQMEGIIKGDSEVKSEFITAENINDLLEKYEVPENFDLLSIDIDGNDYWVWKEITRKPNVVIIEYNSNFNINDSFVLEYDPEHIWDGTYAYSASFNAMKKLGESKGYYIYKEHRFTNLIFVKNEFIDLLPPVLVEEKLKLPHKQHKQILHNKKFIEV